jgi:hypothetical protein
MSFNLALPSRDRFDGILAPLVGSEGGGVAGAADFLAEIDVTALTSELTTRLDAALAGTLPAGGGGAVPSDLIPRFEAALARVPADPAALLQPLTGRLGAIRERASNGLAVELGGGLAKLEVVHAEVPPDLAPLLAGLDPALERIKASLISGAFAQLRTWSDRVLPFAEAIERVAATSTDSVQTAVIQWLAGKVADLINALLPDGESAVSQAAARLSAIAASRPAEAASRAADELTGAFRAVGARFGAGDVSTVAPLSDAEAKLAALIASLDGTSRELASVLGSADPSALATDFTRRLSFLRELEIVDLGSLKEGFADAIGEVQRSVEAIDLEGVAGAIRAPLERVAEAVHQLDLDALPERVRALAQELDDLVAGLEAALLEVVATVRGALAQARETLRALAETLGRFEPDGSFRFHLADELDAFLGRARDGLEETVLPMIEEFRARIGDLLARVREALEGVRGQIEGVRAELEAALDGAATQVEGLDLERRVEEIAGRIRAMLDQLGSVDFDLVTDPVVAELGEMQGSLRELDPSKLNDLLRQSLKLAVHVVVEIEFTADITEVLVQQMDRLLEPPREALARAESTLEGGLAELGRLRPSGLLTPLDRVFAPVREGLDALRLEVLTEPLDAWHRSAVGAVESVSPAALLAPLVEVHAGLVRAVEALDPTALTAPLRSAIAELVAELRRIDVTTVAGDLEILVARVRQSIAAFDPARLLAPASEAFAKIVGALDRFDPAALLAPFARVFAWLEGALEGLTDTHAEAIGVALEPLASLSERLDPERAYASLRGAADAAAGAVAAVAPGRLLAQVQASYRTMLAAIDVSRAPPDVGARLAALNPIRHEGLAQAVATLAAEEARVRSELATARPPESLRAAYAEVEGRATSLAPAWIEPGMSAESVRRAVRRANPLAVEAEVRELWEAVKTQLRALDPAALAAPLSEAFDEVTRAIDALDPTAVLALGQETIQGVGDAVEAVDLSLIETELAGVTDDLGAVVRALDPAAVIGQLEQATDALRAALDRLRPTAILEGLNEPLGAAREVVQAFDPAALREPLDATYERIQRVIASIDVAVLLAPLLEKLEELRAGLEASLRRTATAFNDMLRAIPL